MSRTRFLTNLLALCAIALAGIATFQAPASAAPAQSPLNQAVQARLLALLAAPAAKVNATLDRDPKLREMLRADLEAIGKITSRAARSPAIRAFQMKHGEAYARVLAQAGVDLSALAMQMNALVPAYQFRAEPKRHYISAKARPPLIKWTVPPLVVRRKTEITAFESNNASECGAVSQNTLSDGISMEAELGAFTNCDAVMTRFARFDVPDARQAVLQTPFEFSVWAEAVTIGGVSHASTVVSSAICLQGALYRPALERIFPCEGEHTHLMVRDATVFVFGFWGAEESNSGAESQAQVELPVNRTGMLFAINGHSWSGSGAAGWAKTQASNRGHAVTLQTTQALR
jgi:hypothetical protein